MNLTWLFLAKQFRKKGGIRRISVIFFLPNARQVKKMVKYELKMANNDNLTQIVLYLIRVLKIRVPRVRILDTLDPAKEQIKSAGESWIGIGTALKKNAM